MDGGLTAEARNNMPAAEVGIDEDLVRSLIRDQRPDLVGEELTALASGWDNVSYRIGESRIARLPRRELAVQLIVNEARWLPELAPTLPLAIPAPEYLGEPAGGYPWPWVISPFLRGETAATAQLDPLTGARQLGEFLKALHRPAPADAPDNRFRGGPLSTRAEGVEDRLGMVTDAADRRRLAHLWEESLHAPPHDGAPIWLHADLHPLNLLVADGILTAVIDFGDITAGDPATDLIVGWNLLGDGLEELWRAYGAEDEPLRLRARGWAIALGLAFADTSADHPVVREIGEKTLRAVLDHT